MDYEQFEMVQKGTGSVEQLSKDDNFPFETDSKRSARFNLETGTGYALHLHPGMRETFVSTAGQITLSVLKWDEDADEVVADTHDSVTGESFVVEPNMLILYQTDRGKSQLERFIKLLQNRVKIL